MGDSSAAGWPLRKAVSQAAARPRALTPGELAWAAFVPCTLLTLAAVTLLGPPLGERLLAPHGLEFWPSVHAVQAIRPEPVEHARYLLALGGPVLLCAAIALARPAALLGTRIAFIVTASQALLIGALATALIAQRRHVYEGIYGGPLRRAYFTAPTLAVAFGVAALLVVLLRRQAVADVAARWSRDTRRRRFACTGAALGFTVLWLLSAVFLDDSVGLSGTAINVTLPFSLDEAYAVLNGRTPLVDFHAQYGQLWPYLAALAMTVFGASITTYTITMASATALVLLAVYAMLRRIVGSALGALALYAPFVATSFFMFLGPTQDRYAPSNLFTIFPVRYGGPYLLAWLTSRHVDGARPHAVPLLFCAAGLVALNNPEFGIAGTGATFAALLWTQRPLTLRGVLRLVAAAVVGLLAAMAAVTALTLVSAGSLPRFGLLLEFARIDGVEGWTLLPLPAIGFHLALYATFGAALAVATVRTATRAPGVALTGMLAWSGVFGLGAGSYFVGRSHPEVLIDLFSAWALALTLLLVVAIRAIRARAGNRPTLAELAVLFGFGLCVCSLAQFPTPWSQVQRLSERGVEPATIYLRFPAADRFVGAGTRAGEHVLILLPLGHRVAHEHGVTNVLPWVSIESMPLVSQFDEALAALRAAGGRKVFLWTGNTWPETIQALKARGFTLRRSVAEPSAEERRLMQWSAP